MVTGPLEGCFGHFACALEMGRLGIVAVDCFSVINLLGKGVAHGHGGRGGGGGDRGCLSREASRVCVWSSAPVLRFRLVRRDSLGGCSGHRPVCSAGCSLRVGDVHFVVARRLQAVLSVGYCCSPNVLRRTCPESPRSCAPHGGRFCAHAATHSRCRS
jgi:hypothetical protein